MKSVLEPGVFKPTQSRIEARSDATTRVARDIISGETAARAAQMARLRAARMEQEAAAEPVVVAVKKKAVRKK